LKDILINLNKNEKEIAEKVFASQRITNSQALYLFQKASIDFCGYLANYIKEKRFDYKVFYNRNIHVEVSNICVNKCKFCSFYRDNNSPDAWDKSVDEVIQTIKQKSVDRITEIHITGALHQNKGLSFYKDLFEKVRLNFPDVHIKALTAVEIEYLSKIEKISISDVLEQLKKSGLQSLAGGGAEILVDNIRTQICKEKTDSQTWLNIHNIAHNKEIQSNCTMLYGHIESYQDRIMHFDKLRNLQDQTNGFNCFIPLKYKAHANSLAINKEINLNEELKNYAISRIYFDNIPHIKAYWPMCGKDTAFLSLNFGVDDIDGTINDSTKIYSMAGSNEKNPEMSIKYIKQRCKEMNFVATERDSLYNEI
jgi:aminodeoxyfutalosine synthase